MKTAQLLLASGYHSDSNPGRLWGLQVIGIFLLLFLASRVAWGGWAFWQVSYGYPLMGLSILAYLVSAVVSSRLKLLPRAEGIGVIALAVLLSFLTIVGVMAFGRLYYSRSFLAVAFGFSLTWLSLSYFLGAKTLRLTLAVLPGGMNRELIDLPGIEWKTLENPEDPAPCNGVVVDLHQKLPDKWMRFLSDCSLKRIPVYHSAVVYEAATGRVSLSHLSEGIIEDFRISSLYAIFKRIVDLLLVVLASPFLLFLGGLIAIGIRLDSAGPALFWQERVGLRGKSFRMYKFRSMRFQADGNEARFALPRDRRITRVGNIIRRFRLDELPQFWNILMGEMSLIGPRPEQVSFSRQFEAEIPFYPYRHLVRPGITGWAQVNQGYAAGSRETRDKLEFDLYYIKHNSFLLDVLICLKTLRTVVTGYGAR